MYPFLRLLKEVMVARRQPPLGVLGTHVSHHICWPWDLDPFAELNNGRTLTLFDLGRIPLARRTGLDRVLAAQGWGITVAGSAPRYRRRVVVFDRLRMVSRCIGWDARFLYMEQSMWRGAECTSHIVIRSAIVSKGGVSKGGASKAGIVPPAQAMAAMGLPVESPPLPSWVQAWIAAEALRPWPPVL